MGNTRRKVDPSMEKSKRRGRPATTPEAREQQLANLSYDLAERQIREGTASAQVVTHFLKVGSARERLELERLRRDNALLTAKVEQIEAQKQGQELFNEAILAMGVYSGREVDEYADGDY